MSRIRLAAVVLLALTACAGLPFFGKKESRRAEILEKVSRLAGKPLAYSRARLEVHDAHYDGEYFWGRLLITPMDGPLLLDRRIISTVDVDVGSVRDCRTGEPLLHRVVDIFPPSISDDDVLILEPGYWYGGEVRFPLFAEELTGIGPECVEVQLDVLSFDRKLVGSTFARATRALQQARDGGSLEGSLPVLDAGSPDAGVEVMP